MKLSALIAVSLPIVAMAQLPAMAGEPGTASTDNWLKQSIATLDKKTATTRSHKVSHSSPARSSGATMRLRPFQPNRYLPKASELQAQQARYDYSVETAQQANAPLSGRVSAYAASRPVSAYDQYAMHPQSSFDEIATSMAHKIAAAKKSLGTRSPRMTPGQTLILPEQLTTVPEPPTTHNNLPFSLPSPMQLVQKMQMAKQFCAQMGGQQMPLSMQQMPGGFNPMQAQQMQSQQMQLQQQQQMQMQIQQQMQMQMQMQQQAAMQQQQQQQQMQQMSQQQMPQMQMQPMQQQYSVQQMPSGNGMGMQTARRFAPSDMEAYCQREGNFTQQQQAQLSQLVAMNPPTARMNMNGDIVGTASDNPVNGTGQPPIPMNFSGGNPMMQALQASHRPANVKQARFGSWHNRSNLPQAGFQSYLTWHQPKMYDLRGSVSSPARRNPYTQSRAVRDTRKTAFAPASTKSTYKAAQKSSKFAAKTTIAQAQTSKPRTILATYPMYTSNHGAMY